MAVVVGGDWRWLGMIGDLQLMMTGGDLMAVGELWRLAVIDDD